MNPVEVKSKCFESGVIGIAEIRNIVWDWKRRKTSAFTYGITPVMRRNTRLKRSKAGWFPRVPRSLLDARYRGYERAERYREKARPSGPRWKAMRNLSEMTSARPSSPAKGLIPEESCIVWGKKGSRATPSFLPPPFCFLLFVYLSSPPPFSFSFSRKRAVSCHLRSSSSECHERINAINRLEEGFFFFFTEKQESFFGIFIYCYPFIYYYFYECLLLVLV